MKFSVLLPTCNRLKFLKYAVASVLGQDYDDWEVVISDNASEEDIRGYVESLNEPRIKYFRTEKFVSVTENWNNSMNLSSGDYVIMLGDDDILLKGYFSKMNQLLEEYKHPNLIYANAYIYGYPKVVPNHPDGLLLSCRHYPVFGNAKEPFWLTKEMSMNLVDGHLNFKARYGTNMQYILIKQSIIQKLKVGGQFFHSPYPDVYAMNVLLLEIENILVYPNESVVIGISPKSTGNFLVNNKEKKGMDFLNISQELQALPSLFSIILPGSPSLTSWLVSMETVRLRYKDRFNLSVNYKRYRLLQIELPIKGFFAKNKSIEKEELVEIFKKLTLKEKVFHFLPLFVVHFCKRFSPLFIKKALGKIYNKIFSLSDFEGDGTIDKEFSNIFEIFEHHDNGVIYTDEQIETLLEEMESGKNIEKLCQDHGISSHSLYGWKAKRQEGNLAPVQQFDLLKKEIVSLKKAVAKQGVAIDELVDTAQQK